MTKASPGRRSRRLERRGRPAGSYKSLFKDAQRFSIAAWLASEPRYGPHVAARMAIVLIEERTPITIQDVEGLLLVIGADYKATASAKARTSSDLDGRASQLADKARLMIARATPRELAWLTRSSGALRALSTFFSWTRISRESTGQSNCCCGSVGTKSWTVSSAGSIPPCARASRPTKAISVPRGVGCWRSCAS